MAAARWHASAVSHSDEEVKGDLKLYVATRGLHNQVKGKDCLILAWARRFPGHGVWTRADVGHEGQSADDAAATLSCFVILQLLMCEEQLAHKIITQFTVIPGKTTPALPGFKLCSAAPNPHLHQPPPAPTPTAAKGRDPTQNLEAGSQWLFLFCTIITEHHRSFFWILNTSWPHTWHAPQHGPQQLVLALLL